MYRLLIPVLITSMSVHCLATPDSVLQNLISEIVTITTFKAAVKRIQTFKDFTQVAEGKVDFDKEKGISYDYYSPGKFRLIYTDSNFHSIDLNKQTVNSERSAKEVSLRKPEPLGRFFGLTTIYPQTLFFQGSFDSVMVFKNDSFKEDYQEYIGLDRRTGRLTVLEWFNAKNELIEQTKFYYKKSPVPASVVTRSFAGGDLLIDSFSIIKPKVH